MGQNVHGSKAGALLDGRDLTRFTTDFNFATDIDMAEQTCLMADGGAKEYLYGNAGSSAGLDGRLAKSRPQLERELDAIRGQEEGAKLFLQAPAGFAPGAPAVIFQTLKEKLSVKGGMTNVNGTGMSFIADGVTRVATMLLAPRVPKGADVKRDEIQTLSFAGADPNQFFGLRASGTTQTWQFQLGSYATDAALAAAVKAGVEGLAAYAGRTVTVAVLTPRSGGAALSLALKVTFDGAINVAGLEAISGAVDAFVVSNGESGATYGANGGELFALGIAEGAFQTNQRTLGGERQDVVCKGASVANTGPGKRQRIVYDGNGPLSVGGVAVDLNTPESVNTLVGRIKTALPTRTTLTGAGTITKAVAGTVAAFPDQITVTGAGTPEWDGTYNKTANQLFGAPIYQKDSTHYLVCGEVATSGGANAWRLQDNPTLARSGSFNDPYAYYINSQTATSAVAFGQYTTGTLATNPGPTVAGVATGGTSGAFDVTFAEDARAGNTADLPVVGTDAASVSAGPQPNGTANFKSYYPLNRAPAAPTKSGTGATNTRLTNRGDATVSLTGATVQEGGSFSGLNLITAPTNFPAVQTADAATATGATVDLHATLVSNGALSVPVVVETLRQRRDRLGDAGNLRHHF